MITRKDLAKAIARASALLIAHEGDRLLERDLGIFLQEASASLIDASGMFYQSTLAYAGDTIIIREMNGGQSLFDSTPSNLSRLAKGVPVKTTEELDKPMWTPSAELPPHRVTGLGSLQAI